MQIVPRIIFTQRSAPTGRPFLSIQKLDKLSKLGYNINSVPFARHHKFYLVRTDPHTFKREKKMRVLIIVLGVMLAVIATALLVLKNRESRIMNQPPTVVIKAVEISEEEWVEARKTRERERQEEANRREMEDREMEARWESISGTAFIDLSSVPWDTETDFTYSSSSPSWDEGVENGSEVIATAESSVMTVAEFTALWQ